MVQIYKKIKKLIQNSTFFLDISKKSITFVAVKYKVIDTTTQTRIWIYQSEFT